MQLRILLYGRVKRLEIFVTELIRDLDHLGFDFANLG